MRYTVGIMSQESFTALYRKYRPQTFKDVEGQDHVVKVLEGAIKNGTIAHAYLFAGSRGLGKTSIARIFARELGTTVNDLYEIDAASNRGIDDVRELRESVGTVPFESPYKVYIVDEVHMLTKEAFNALLKTLEEPPKHVIFILATTETDKLPETVVSRCQVFSFKKPSQKLLTDMVTTIAKKEGFTLDAGAAGLIALLGDGSFRDTQGMLQKVIGSSSAKKITVEDVEMVTGAPRGTLVNDVVEGISVGNREKALLAIQKAAELNIDMKTLAKLILEKLRFVLLLKSASAAFKPSISAELSAEDFTFIEKLALDKEGKIGGATLVEFLSAYSAIGHSYVSELPLELAVIKLTS